MSELLTGQEEELLNQITVSKADRALYEAGRCHEQIPIPAELEERVRQAIEEGKKRNRQADGRRRRKRGLFIALRAVGALAAAVVLFMIPLNTNEAFARQMSELPIVGKVARVLTVRSYSYSENGVNVDASVPEIAIADADETAQEETVLENTAASDFAADVNAEIAEIVERCEEDAKRQFEEYREAFFATGGTEEEWGGRTCDVSVDYTVTYNEGAALSLILTTTESWVAAYGQRYYYNLDMENGRNLTLEDVLGPDWKALCDAGITAQIEERIAAEDVVYWGFGESADDDMEGFEGFSGVTESTQFYINGNGNAVVCFDKYEIAPGYMGVQEFEITREE